MPRRDFQRTERVNLLLSVEERRMLERLSEATDLTMSVWIRQAIRREHYALVMRRRRRAA